MSESTALARLSHDELVAAALARSEEPAPPNTQKAYEAAWERWRRWCAEAGLDADAPVPAIELCGLLEQMAREGLAHATLELTVSGISVIDVWTRTKLGDPHPVPVRSHPRVRRFMRKHAEATKERPKRKAPALLRPDLVAVIGELLALRPQRGTSPIDVMWLAQRDHALLLVGWSGALRTDSIARLRVNDLRELDDGLELFLRASKTDQIGHGDTKHIYPASVEELCARTQWQRWSAMRGELGELGGEAYAFVSRDGERLSPNAIADIVRRRCRAANVKASGHSLRAGLATWAKLCGRPESDIQAHGGWKTTAAMHEYFQRARARQLNPTLGLL